MAGNLTLPSRRPTAFHGRPRRHRHHERRFFESRGHAHRAYGHAHAHSQHHHDAHRLVSASHVVENSYQLPLVTPTATPTLMSYAHNRAYAHNYKHAHINTHANNHAHNHTNTYNHTHNHAHFPAHTLTPIPTTKPTPTPSITPTPTTTTTPITTPTTTNRVPSTRKSGHGSRWALTYHGAAHEPAAAINNTVSNVTAQLGGAAFLPCRVGHLGDRQISWIRKRDWHVLTSGEILYTPDRRFSVLHVAGSQDWTLHIKYVSVKDNGTYECQVSTGTGIISLFVNLAVVTPEAHIPGHGQYHVNRGSPITLVCAIENVPTPPQYVFWYHNGRLLNYLPDQPEVTIETSREPSAAVSKLEVRRARDDHSGNYTCSAPNTLAASTMVFVTEGDKTAAVQRIDSSSAAAAAPLAALPLLAASYVLAVR
ncbi:titin-like [Penaeus indicus]|uniref:titin-like n=1 Tax=Penaeus indicus TaxID=29960 RepID=UPI00300CBAC5